MFHWWNTLIGNRRYGQVPQVALRKKQRKVLRNVIGAAVRRARERRNLSQEALAAKLQLFGWDIPRMTITKIELGHRCVSDVELVAIAESLSVSTQTLLADADRQIVRKVLGIVRR